MGSQVQDSAGGDSGGGYGGGTPSASLIALE